ncbi:hypothetical protein [Paractinoplanes deccanensis]|uniref:hypothetical protein n=1 Tax=Paractinoplanes deccanensis TaxID=113561 RepID=UPI003672D36F
MNERSLAKPALASKATRMQASERSLADLEPAFSAARTLTNERSFAGRGLSAAIKTRGARRASVRFGARSAMGARRTLS